MLQALGNLVSNAITFTAADGRVTVRAEEAPAGVSFVVEDSGAGISPEVLSHVFDRYFHSAQVKREAREGHGLGLAIVKGIVEAHGGTVRAESAPGSGSAFSFTLPFRPSLPGTAHAR